MEDLHYLSALKVGELIQSQQLSASSVTQTMLERIDSLSGLKAFVTVTPELAMAQAEQADAEISQGNIKSPLHGVPIALKDLLATKGVATSNGMSIYKDSVPDYDATVVSRLAEAGTVTLGKLKLTEGAFAQHHPLVEQPENPWDSNLWTGVSSSGSGVATAAGLCFGSLGTDTGGSIRYPSAANGLVGLKPTWGRVSRFGAFPLAYSLDHIGPITRSVDDAAAMLQIIAGYDADDPTSSRQAVPDYLENADLDLSNLRIGLDENYIGDSEHASAVREVLQILEARGCSIVEITINYAELSQSWPITTGVEAAHAHSETFPGRRDEYGVIAGLLDVGLSATAADYMQTEIARRAFKAELAGNFENCDLIICPSMPLYMPPREGSAEMNEAQDDLTETMKFTAPYNYSGSPTLSLPWTRSEGVPASVQFVARDFEEKLLIDLGRMLEVERGALPCPL